MTFAAWFALHSDDVVVAHPTAIRVYAVLLRNPRICYQPQDVKAWLIAETLHTHRDRVNAALNLLIHRGYVLEHGRGQNNVRQVTVLLERDPTATCPRREAPKRSA